MLLTPAAELESRLIRFQDALRGRGLDAAIVVGNVDLFYLTGTMQQGHLLVPAQGEPQLLVRKDPERARRESQLTDVASLSSFRELPAALARLGVPDSPRIALELDILPVVLFRRYEALFSDARIEDCGLLLRELRAVKSDYELDRLRVSATLADEVVRSAAEFLREGITELQLSAHIEGAARAAGHSGFNRMRAFNQEMLLVHVYAGPDAGMASYLDGPFAGEGLSPAVPQGAGRRMIRRGEPVVVDFGGVTDGYIVDQTRVLSVGPLPDDLAAAYQACLDIQEVVAQAARAGVVAGDVYSAALAAAERRGLTERFMGASPNQVSFVGHGVGLEIDELPIMARGVDTYLEERNVVASEPKLIFPGRGAVGVENTWVVRPHGLERLTLCSDRVWEV